MADDDVEEDVRLWDEAAGPERPPGIRILICTPVYGDTVKRGYAFSVAQAIAYFAQVVKSDVPKYIDIQMVFSSSIVENRHRLVAKAFQFEATHMLFWDADIEVPPDAIVRLLNHDQPIVAINYPKKEIEARPTAYIDADHYTGPCWTQKQHTGLQEVSSCGFGLMLIRMDVLQAIDLPLFQMTQVGPNGSMTLTEDVFFCEKARAKGYHILIDHDLSKECAHLGEWRYTCDMADIAQAAKQQLYRAMPTSEPDVPL